MTGECHEFDLAIRSEVRIDAPPDVVWQALDRLGEWKRTVASVERISGPRGGIGEVVRVGQRAGEEIVYVTHRTVSLEPFGWRVQWLETEDGRSTRGYLAYSLQPLDRGTRLVGELLARAALPAGSMAGRSDEEASRMITEATRDKFHADHMTLKRLVERAKNE